MNRNHNQNQSQGNRGAQNQQRGERDNNTFRSGYGERGGSVGASGYGGAEGEFRYNENANYRDNDYSDDNGRVTYGGRNEHASQRMNQDAYSGGSQGGGQYDREQPNDRQFGNRQGGQDWNRGFGSQGDYSRKEGLNRFSGGSHSGSNYSGGNWNDYGVGRSGGHENFGGNFGQQQRNRNDEQWQTGTSGQQQRSGRGPKNYQRSDERIKEDICDRLHQHDYADASDVEVSVKGGEVTLSGTVSDRNTKRAVEDVAESVLGVKDVQNQIKTSSSQTGTTSSRPSSTLGHDDTSNDNGKRHDKDARA
jgi:osmotically-inducible protein OsmY